MRDRLAEKHARVVDEVARREVVGAVDDHVVVAEEALDVSAVEPLLVADDFHVRVQVLQHLLRALHLGHPDAARRVEHLALEVRRVDRVGIDEAERADAGGREIERRR